MTVTIAPSPTRAEVEAYGVEPTGTRALSIGYQYLRTDISMLRTQVEDLDAKAQDGHNDVRQRDLESRTNEKAKKDVPALLAELGSDRGMGWSYIAELAGVSVSAIRKWRKGGAASPENRRGLARIAAMLDMLEQVGVVSDPAGWMEMNLSLGPGFYIRPIDLYLEGHDVALLDLAETPSADGGAALLDRIKPGWRSQQSQFEVIDVDGERILRLRGE